MKEIRKGSTIKLKVKISSIREVELNCTVLLPQRDRLFLSFPPQYEEYAQYLNEGQELTAVLHAENGLQLFDSIILNSPLDKHFIIEYDTNATIVQRREYVRVKARIDMMLETNGKYTKATTENIGGGGIKFNAIQEFKKNDTINYSLKLPEMDNSIKGTLRIIKIDKHELGTSYVGIYTTINETDRNKIIKFCFEKEANIQRNSE